MVDSECKEGNNNQEEYAMKKRVWFPIDRINQYDDLARLTKEVRNYLRYIAVMWLRMEDDDMAE